MKICDIGSYSLVSVDTPTITEKDVSEITDFMYNNKKPVIIDMMGVESCINKFYILFKDYPGITLLNTDSKVLTTLFITGFDRYVKIFDDKVSFADNLRELKQRRFCVV